MDRKTVYARVIDCGIMPTTFVYDLDQTVALAKTLYDGGIEIIELLQRTPMAPRAIAAVKAAVPGMLVGAGTVTTVEKARIAADAGADYLVTPFYNQTLVDWCNARDIAIVPGCATITEVSQGYDSGLRMFKYFPIKQLGGAEAIRQIGEIYSDARYVITGGIHYEDVFDYAAVDRIAAIGTVCMMPQALIAARDWPQIAELTRKTVAASLGFELAWAGEDTLDLLGLFSRNRSAVPEVPEGIRDLEPKRSVGLYVNSVPRALAYFRRRGVTAAVLSGDVLGPTVADVKLPGFAEPVRLVARSAAYRA